MRGLVRSCALVAAVMAVACDGVTVSVKDFGAVGDGVTDDFAAISAALQSLNGSGTLFFPSATSSTSTEVDGGRYALSEPLVVSGYAVRLVGEGARPLLVSRAGAGTSLLALSGNSSLVVFDQCTFCSLEGMLLSHAATSTSLSSPTAAVARRRTAAPRSVLHPTCVDGTTSCQRRLQRAKWPPTLGGNVQRSFSSPSRLPPLSIATVATPAATTTTIEPTSGAGVTIRGSFQITLEKLWLDSMYRMVWVTDFANTVTFLDSQLSNVFGDCGASRERVCVCGDVACRPRTQKWFCFLIARVGVGLSVSFDRLSC